MSSNEDLSKIFDRIAKVEESENDIKTLREILRSPVSLGWLSQDGEKVIQIGRNIVNIAEGRDIQIGDRIYQGTDAEAIKEALRLVLQEKQKGKRPSTEKLLLQAVKDEVTARLNQSLHNAVSINLGKEAQSQQVKRNWSSDIKIGNSKREYIDEDTNILEVFDQEEIVGKLLILGNPGAGKTTTMLDLAKDLVTRSEQLADYPIPVLLNLSTWKDNKQSMRDWLVEELKSKYGVLKDIGASWIDNAKLLPMLDGLDELESIRQELCVRKINQFLQSDYRSSYLVICSRREEYEKVVRQQIENDEQSEEALPKQETRLHLNGAIVLQPLTDEQIKTHLIELKQIELWKTLQIDTELLELVKTPLFLSILGFISFDRTLSVDEWGKLTSTELRIKYLLDTYWKTAINRELATPQMELEGSKSLSYRKKNLPSQKQTRKWLVYLAKYLERESQTEFLIEKIQPDSFLNRWNKQIYASGIGLFFGLVGGLIVGTISGVITLIFINIIVGAIVGLIVGIFFVLFFGIWAFLTIGQSSNIEPVETLNRSGLNIIKASNLGLFIGMISWLITRMIFPLFGSQPPELVFFMVIGSTLVSIFEISGPQLQIPKKPNHGIWNSLNNAIGFALFGGIWLGFFAFLKRHQIFSLILSLLFKKSPIEASFMLTLPDTVVIVLSAILAGLFFGLTQAGTACIQHFTLRFILYRNNYIPWNYARFLNYCTERIFLQRVGGRYRFIHRLLQEHFATMPSNK